MNKLTPGDIIKETWYFWGICNFGYFKAQFPVFRFIVYDHSLCLDLTLNRVSRMGWQVSDYTYEVVTEQQKNDIVNSSEFTFDSYYKVYRRIS